MHKVIIAGSGRGLAFADRISRNPEFHSQASVCAIADIRTDNHPALRERLNQYGMNHVRICTTLPEALEKFPDADCVFVVTPNTTHAELTEQTLNAGRHLMLEKPVAADWPDACRILKCCRAHPELTVQLGFTLRYATFYRKIISLVDSGTIGSVVMIRSNERLSFAHSNAYRRGWRRHTAATGGLMNEKCSHDLDIMNRIMGRQTEPLQVFSVGGRELFPPRPDTPRKCADCPDDKCVFRFASAGKKGRYNLARNDEYFLNCIYHTDADVMTNQSVTVRYSNNAQGVFTIVLYAGNDEQRDIMVHGTEGLIAGDLKHGTIELKIFREGTHEIFEAPGGMHGDGDDWTVRSFFRCMDCRQQPEATVYDGITASRIAFAANLSAEEHRLVNLADFPVP